MIISIDGVVKDPYVALSRLANRAFHCHLSNVYTFITIQIKHALEAECPNPLATELVTLEILGVSDE